MMTMKELEVVEGLIAELRNARYWIAAEVVPVKAVRQGVLRNIDAAIKRTGRLAIKAF